MKNIYLKAYMRNNLGDDLFIRTICERYPDTIFHVIASNRNITLESISNLRAHKPGLFIRFIRKALKFDLLEAILRRQTDAMIYIGGSIFMEKDMKKLMRNISIYRTEKPYYIIGFNIGPYSNESYLKYINENVFKNAAFLGVRDKNSYSLLNYKQNAIYAPDIMFSVAPQLHPEPNKNYAIISVLDMNRKVTAEQARRYETYIINLCNILKKEKITPILMSFCNFEGDETIINRIKELDESITDYRYRGNIEEAMSLFANAKLVFGTRFHASILALNYQIPLIPFAYSSKTTNLLNSIGYGGEILTIDNLDTLKTEKIISNALSSKKPIDLQETRKQSDKHFKELDQLLK